MKSRTISHYRIEEELGRGGMGEVYLADDLNLERKVAIKLLSPHLTTDKEYIERFQREAKAAASLNHPNIVTIHEIAEEDGQIFIVMEYIEGKSLRDVIDEYKMGLDKIIDIFSQIIDGLNQAHQLGIVHRDLKPENIIVGKDARIRILDFGLAKFTGRTKLTREGSTLGTVNYMSPEQVKGEEIDHRSDIWSLGVMLYEILTGQLPFNGKYDLAVIYSIINENPLPPRQINDQISVEFEKVIMKCLDKDCFKRYQSVKNILSDLKKISHQDQDTEFRTVVAFGEKSEEKKEIERRHATILFADIYGYREMLKEMTKAEADSIIKSCFLIFETIAAKYGGKLDKIREDGFEILFGVPEIIENSPREAVNTALEMRKKLYDFNRDKKLSVPLDIHIGINTGTVITGSLDRDSSSQVTVVGDTVKIASYLKELSAKGQIYVGSSTYKNTRDEFNYHLFKPSMIKTKSATNQIYELLSAKQKIIPQESIIQRIISSDLVGRDKELNKLRLTVLKLINGDGSIVSIIGDAGIGKSRLINEFHKIEDLNNLTILEGRALSISKNIHYHPIIDVLKCWAAINDSDSNLQSISKLESFVHKISPEAKREMIPFLATLMGLKLTGKYEERIRGIEGDALEKLIRKTFRDLIVTAVSQRSMVFIVNDIHWADLSSIELIESLFKLVEDHRILFIIVMRPGYSETGERILETLRKKYGALHSEINLEPLNEKHSEILIQNLIKDSKIPYEIQRKITHRAAGNPFFIEEVIRSFIDDGAIEIHDGKFKINKKMDLVEIPETIQEVLMARIDRLGETTKSLLRYAAAIGRYFFYKIITDIAKTIEDIDYRLEFLEGIELISERIRFEEIEYLFKHILIQEVIYDSILYDKRKELHRKVAESIESVFSSKLSEFYGMLAYHYSNADEPDKAEEYMLKAGEAAMKSSASNEALFYYTAALNIYSNKYGVTADPDKLALMEKNIALAYYNKGRYKNSLEFFNKALSIYWGKIPTNSILFMLKFIGGFLHVLISLYLPPLKWKKIPTQKDIEIFNLYYKKLMALGHIDPRDVFFESFFILKSLTNYDLKKIENGAAIFAGASLAFSWTGISFTLSKKILDSVKEKINKNYSRSFVFYETYLITHNFFVGNWSQGIDKEVIYQGKRVAEIFSLSNYIIFQGRKELEKGNFKNAMQMVNLLAEISNEFEHEYPLALKYFLNTKILLKYRKLWEASQEAGTGIDFINETGLGTLRFGLYSLKVRIESYLGNLTEAQNYWLTASKIKSEVNLTPCYLGEFLISQFMLEFAKFQEIRHNGEKHELKRHIKNISEIGTQMKKNCRSVASDKTEVYRLLGIFNWELDKKAESLNWFAKSILIGDKLRANLELARTYFELGKRLINEKRSYKKLNDMKGQEFLSKAEGLVKEMNLEEDFLISEEIRI